MEDQQNQVPQQQQQFVDNMAQNYSKLNIGTPFVEKHESDGVEEVAETLTFCNALNERV